MNAVAGPPRRMTYNEASEQAAREFDCDCRAAIVVRRTLRNQSVQFCRQCPRCGGIVGKPAIPHADLDPQVRRLAPPFDDGLLGRYQAERLARIKAIYQADGEAWFRWYDQYLASPEWSRKRRLVLDRCGGTCEGCRSRPATQVHHLTYDHVGDELLFELVALCNPCHEHVHREEPE